MQSALRPLEHGLKGDPVVNVGSQVHLESRCPNGMGQNLIGKRRCTAAPASFLPSAIHLSTLLFVRCYMPSSFAKGYPAGATKCELRRLPILRPDPTELPDPASCLRLQERHRALSSLNASDFSKSAAARTHTCCNRRPLPECHVYSDTLDRQ